MRLYLDDVRVMPGGYDGVARDAEEAISLLSRGGVEHISFDHDLGEGPSGYEVACFIEEGAYRGDIGPMTWEVHSANPVGAARIKSAMLSAERHWQRKK